jgi:hypothetical protein
LRDEATEGCLVARPARDSFSSRTKGPLPPVISEPQCLDIHLASAIPGRPTCQYFAEDPAKLSIRDRERSTAAPWNGGVPTRQGKLGATLT